MPPITKAQAKLYGEKLLAENPLVDPYFIELLLSVYEKSPAFVDNLVKADQKKNAKVSIKTTAPERKRPVETRGVRVLTPEEFEWPEQKGAELIELKTGAEAEAEMERLQGEVEGQQVLGIKDGITAVSY